MTQEEIFETVRLNRKFGDILPMDKLEAFSAFAAKGSEMDLREGIRLMVAGFIDNCGISKGFRTVYYDAGGALLEEFLKTDDPLAKELVAEDQDLLIFCMERFNEDYSKDEYGEYGVTVLNYDEYLIYCMQECSYNLPSAMKAVLCYGIYLLIAKGEI